MQVRGESVRSVEFLSLVAAQESLDAPHHHPVTQREQLELGAKYIVTERFGCTQASVGSLLPTVRSKTSTSHCHLLLILLSVLTMLNNSDC